MADTFNLRAFLSENKLTKNAKLLKESTELNGKLVDTNSIEIDGNYPSDVFIISADFEDGTQLSDEEVQQLEREYPNLAGEVGYDKQTSGFDYDEDYGVEEGFDTAEEDEDQDEYLKGDPTVFSKNENTAEVSDDTIQKKYNEMFGRNPSTTNADVAKALGVPEDRVGTAVAHTAVQGIKLNETTNKMTTKERKLVKMVQEAMGMEGYGNDNVNLKRDKEGLPPIQGPTYSEGDEIAEEEMVQKESLPKYESIDKLMKDIEEGTNKAMYEYKIKAMEEIASKLEEKANSLEEGEHKEYINPQEIKKLRKDLGDIRRQVEKLRKDYDKKFNKKGKAAAPKKEEVPVALAEGTFDLKKFLVENKITVNSRLIKEEISSDMENIEGWVLEQPVYEDLSPEELEALAKDYLEEWEGSKENFNSLEEYLDTVEENGDYL